jgi:signal transduction histidine kinase
MRAKHPHDEQHRFRQADATATRRTGGLGLGLAISRQLIELHGGSVSVHSAGIGDGTTFTVRLPLAGEMSDVRAEVSISPCT